MFSFKLASATASPSIPFIWTGIESPQSQGKHCVVEPMDQWVLKYAILLVVGSASHIHGSADFNRLCMRVDSMLQSRLISGRIAVRTSCC